MGREVALLEGLWWEPRLTNVIRNTDEKILSNMKQRFSEIMGFEVKCSIVKLFENERGCEQWHVTYRGYSKDESRQASVQFSTTFYDESVRSRERTTRFLLDKPIIKICDIIVHPKREGMGSQIIDHFIREVKKTQFEQIILKAQGGSVGEFWSKFGFLYKDKTSQTMPSMYLDLNPQKKKASVQ